MITKHELKCWPELFQAIVEDKKTHDLRHSDRNFKVGDVMLLKEYDPLLNIYSGRQANVEITYITSAYSPCALSTDALKSEYCILSIKRLSSINENVKDFLKECDCNDSDYSLCLEYLQQDMPELDIDCIYSDDCYITGREELIKMAKECLQNRKDDE